MPGIYEQMNFNLQGAIPTRLGSSNLPVAGIDYTLYTVPAGSYARFVRVVVTNRNGIKTRFSIDNGTFVYIDQELDAFDTFILEMGGLDAGASIRVRTYTLGLNAVAMGLVNTSDFGLRLLDYCSLEVAEVNQDYVLYGTDATGRALVGFSLRNTLGASSVNVRVGLTDANTNGFTGPGAVVPVNQPGADLEDRDYIWYDVTLQPYETKSLDGELLCMSPNNLLTVRCDRAFVLAQAWGILK